MSREFSRALYHSKAWQKVREAYMRKPKRTPNGTVPPLMCERCFEAGRLRPAEIVHHIVWLTPDNVNDPSVTLDERNLMRVCRDCHAEIHYPDEFRQRVAFDENGRVVPL